LNIEAEELKNLTKKRNLKYIPIINRLSIEHSDYIQSYIKEERDAVSKGVLAKGDSINSFFILTPTPNRYYPEGNLASQIIGFVDNSGA
jgi:cell division protein FtsI/penicillin-binding protein 2